MLSFSCRILKHNIIKGRELNGGYQRLGSGSGEILVIGCIIAVSQEAEGQEVYHVT